MVGANSHRILEAAKTMGEAKKGWINPFGNGKTAEAIIKIKRTKLYKLSHDKERGANCS
jgi:hypothetical protein